MAMITMAKQLSQARVPLTLSPCLHKYWYLLMFSALFGSNRQGDPCRTDTRSGSNISNDSDIVGSCVGRALNALCQMLLWLEGANGTSLELVVCGKEELTGHTDWNSAVSLKGGARPDNSDSRGADPGS